MKLRKEVMAAGGPLLLVHGGAGAIRADVLSEELRLGRVEGIRRSLAAGWKVLAAGGTAVNAICSAVEALEEYPLFNAGRGSVLNSEGHVEMDASIMDGDTRASGALCCSRRLRNPILAARRLMDEGRVFAEGSAVEEWLASKGHELCENDWFHTPDRLAQHVAALKKGRARLDHEAEAELGLEKGTVGAVARDTNGALAAATSTGGMNFKRPGRIGDSPCIGAGTWADSRSLALSATGDGENIIRAALAHEVEARVRLLGQSLPEAVDAAFAILEERGGHGGVVCINHKGEGLLAADTEGMYRGWIDPASGRYGIAIFHEDEMDGGSLDQLV